MKKLFFFLVMLLFATTGFTQIHKDNPEFWEAIRTKRIAVFTQTIGLTPAEAQQFWPIYNAFDKQRVDLMRRRRALDEKLEKSSNVTDADYRKLASEYVSIPMEEARLMQNYNDKYLKILPAQKVCKLYMAERKFRESLMDEFRKNHGIRNR
jgi:Spy/CpxP family protein refolding chaperone